MHAYEKSEPSGPGRKASLGRRGLSERLRISVVTYRGKLGVDIARKRCV